MGVQTLADGNIKFTILTTKPANELVPTITELNAGIDASCLVLQDNFSWTAADSDKINEKALCATTNGETPGAGNSNLAMTAWRWYDPETGAVDPTADTLFSAVKEKGTTLWGYTRVGVKKHSDPWAATDVYDYGARFITDALQLASTTGFIKYVVPPLPQDAWQFGTVGAGA